MTEINNKKSRILVVEDDEPTRESVVLKLQGAGFHVETAEDGNEGLEVLKSRGPFAVVLLDLRMPGGDGFVFLEKKNTDEALREVPVVIFSNMEREEYTKRAHGLGVRTYLLKANFSVQEVVDIVRNAISDTRS